MIGKTNYQVVYLNGPSSAGKSTLARALQTKLHHPFLVVGIDMFISMMPERLNDWHHGTEAPGFSWLPVKDIQGKVVAYKIHIGPFGKRIAQAFQATAVTLAKLGHSIIIDDVSFGKEQVDTWRTVLKNFKTLWIGLTAPLEILEERERERTDRKRGSTRWQAEHVHKDVAYDIMIDMHKRRIEENVEFLNTQIEQ